MERLVIYFYYRTNSTNILQFIIIFDICIQAVGIQLMHTCVIDLCFEYEILLNEK